MFKEKVLLVDDEPNILSGYRRGLRRTFNLSTANSGRQALETMASEGPFAVIVADMRMPAMDGVELLHTVKGRYPDTVRIMLTGNADQETAIQAVNKGSIFRFLNKPCPAQVMTTTLTVAIQQYRLITAEKELLEKTLKGSVKVLVDLLSLADQDIFHHATRLRSYLRDYHAKNRLKNFWELEVAAMLTPIGLLTLPTSLRRKIKDGSSLSKTEEEALSDTTEISHRLLSNIPRLEKVAELVKYSGGSVLLLPTKGEETARIHLFRVFHDLVKREQEGVEISTILDELSKKRTGIHLDTIREVARFFGEEVAGDQDRGWESHTLRIRNIMVGDVLEKNVETISGTMLLATGTTITGAFLERIRNYRKLDGILEPIQVKRRIPRE